MHESNLPSELAASAPSSEAVTAAPAMGAGATNDAGRAPVRGEPPRPLILFDGICNLCSATVRWVLARDRRRQFVFASRQSVAGRRALDAAGAPADLPDSIVLIDEAGVHVRSTAALRIAMRLGFPTALLAVGLLVPRVLRDALYGTIARARYRWFGHRETCMIPPPGAAARFLDADEPRPPIAAPRVDAVTPEVASSIGGMLRGWCVRFAVVYVLAYIAPFPVTLLGQLFQIPAVARSEAIAPALSSVLGAHASVAQPAAQWLGQTLFDVEIDFQPTGSGDRTANYLDALLDLGLAFVVATIWAVLMGGRPVSRVVFGATRLLARFYLGTFMLTYGWAKLFPLQFPVPGPDRLLQPYGDSSPMGLAWTFLGASTAYQMFAGLSELLGGYLLLFRRTSLLGALVTAAVMTNVAAINYCYDVPVKLFSTHLLLIAIFIAAPDLPRLVGVMVFRLPAAAPLPPGSWLRSRAVAWPAQVIKWVIVIGVTAGCVYQGSTMLEQRADVSPWQGIYRVETFLRDGVADRNNLDRDRWVRVGLSPPWVATVQHADGVAVRMRLVVDEANGTLSLIDRGAAPPAAPQFTVTEPEPGALRLDGTYAGLPTTVLMRRQPTESLLRNRPFRWINEYPFNR